jgi:hypothetical protein
MIQLAVKQKYQEISREKKKHPRSKKCPSSTQPEQPQTSGCQNDVFDLPHLEPHPDTSQIIQRVGS